MDDEQQPQQPIWDVPADQSDYLDEARQPRYSGGRRLPAGVQAMVDAHKRQKDAAAGQEPTVEELVKIDQAGVDQPQPGADSDPYAGWKSFWKKAGIERISSKIPRIFT